MAGAEAGAEASQPTEARSAARITVIGLGPAGPEHLTMAAWAAVEQSSAVLLRTGRHPSAGAVFERRSDAVALDAEYDAAADFDEVYDAIVERVITSARETGSVCYAVPGSPVVAEATVVRLRSRARADGLELVVVPAVSYVDLAWDRLGVDPVSAGVQLVDASTFAVQVAGSTAPCLIAQCWSKAQLSSVKLALEEPGVDQRAVILHHLGLPDEVVAEVAWSELDRTVAPDHLTSVYVPTVLNPVAGELVRLAETVAILRRKCPWDREQTHRSLVRHLLEETYEAMEAIEALGDDPSGASAGAAEHAEEELGDLLCQVVFHATLGAEEGLFTLADVARSIDTKLIERHPHVFADVVAETSAEVVENWERAKDLSKRRAHLLDGIPHSMPALARANKVERKLRSVGLGWSATAQAVVPELESLLEGLDRVDAPDAGSESSDPEQVERLAGKVLLLVARALAAAGIDAETVLRHALERLGAQVGALEAAASEAGMSLEQSVSSRGVHEQHQPLC